MPPTRLRTVTYNWISDDGQLPAASPDHCIFERECPVEVDTTLDMTTTKKRSVMGQHIKLWTREIRLSWHHVCLIKLKTNVFHDIGSTSNGRYSKPLTMFESARRLKRIEIELREDDIIDYKPQELLPRNAFDGAKACETYLSPALRLRGLHSLHQVVIKFHDRNKGACSIKFDKRTWQARQGDVGGAGWRMERVE